MMKSNFLKSKLHRIKLTDVHIDYEGSCAIDEDILKAADINEYEMLHIYNLSNGNRFTTYAIKAEKNTGIVSFNGAAAFQGKINDLIIVCTYTQLEASEIKNHKPKLVYFKKNENKVDFIKSKIPLQKAKVLNYNV